MKKIIFFTLILGSVFFFSCTVQKDLFEEQEVSEPTPVVYTQLSEKLIADRNLTPEKFLKIQFFSSSDTAVLKRSYVVKSDTIIKGVVKNREINKVFYVKMEPYTMGKLVKTSGKKLYIAFENDSLTLTFGPNDKGDYVLYGLSKSQVKYGAYPYDLITGDVSSVRLFVNLDQLKREENNVHIVPGLEVK